MRLLQNIELAILNFMLDCFRASDDIGQAQIVKLSFILIERVALCESSNYLIYFDKLL